MIDELKVIATWEVKTLTNYHDFMGYIKDLWRWETYFERQGNIYKLSTGGWSEHEEIIEAMQSNHPFWFMYWTHSSRGGHFKFSPLDRKLS